MDVLVIFAVFISLAAGESTNGCPHGLPHDNTLKVFGDSCFRFVLSRLRTQTLARRDCESHGGHLVLVKSQATQDFLVNSLNNDYHVFYDKLWIGLNDIDKESEFVWEDGTPLAYSNWDQGQGPNATSPAHSYNHDNNDCVVLDLQSDGKWSEYPCEEDTVLLFFPQAEEHSYICQYSLIPSASTTAQMTTSAD